MDKCEICAELKKIIKELNASNALAFTGNSFMLSGAINQVIQRINNLLDNLGCE
jgi:hypothetical protein